jgi:hypothetical protein
LGVIFFAILMAVLGSIANSLGEIARALQAIVK